MFVLCVLFFCTHLINYVIFIYFQLLGQGISLTIFALFSFSLDYSSLLLLPVYILERINCLSESP